MTENPTATAVPPCSAPWDEIRQWRKNMRTQLIAQREALAPSIRDERGARVKARLREEFELGRYRTLGLYWPMRGEIDLLDLAAEHVRAGGRAALPVVVQRSAPVEFWNWVPGSALARGLWDIPIPATREVLQPDALLIPLVGFDRSSFRLGYGGGYYDRTLAVAQPRPLCIGLGYAAAELGSICPQAHDIRLDAIVTEDFLLRAPVS